MGLHKTIKTPEQMWELFEAYQKATKANPFKVQDYVGKDGIMVYREKERPLTLEGFENYCAKTICCVNHYFDNPDNRYAQFSTVCSRIRKEIRQDQIEGGMAGQYNPSITQRLNGLTEKQEVKVQTDVPIFPDVQKNNSDKQVTKA